MLWGLNGPTPKAYWVAQVAVSRPQRCSMAGAMFSGCKSGAKRYATSGVHEKRSGTGAKSRAEVKWAVRGQKQRRKEGGDESRSGVETG